MPDYEHSQYYVLSNLTATDKAMVADLVRELERSGAIERPDDGFVVTPDADLHVLLAEAAAGARYEADLNPHQYHPEVEAIVAAREYYEDDWENPDLETVEVRDVRASFAGGVAVDLLREENEEDALDFVMGFEV